ncbi:WD40/YVTN/BNR-like repeat-containing protein [Pseudothauera rhizosphaerae]|uniref:Photosynthesis system II assembly factor Ycf48/Hcf136-like domain-containing protein n=1 Tax=Pseudothauera rhizosphaerae TaxID=2565932 RepID=A0A4S4A8R7_9RHOO|nr:YCF48-related protein [Pseudothauera rhizosphaerae]THF55173.1 hypothetical protein E6O51_20935 [Pseudothauera rhizosphaerae]
MAYFIAGLMMYCLLAPPTMAAGAAGRLPDLLDLPAPADARAQTGTQLAVARAGERLVAVGVRGTVLLSDDHGRSWRQARAVPVSVALTDVHFPTAQEGWAVGHSGVALHSTDGGETWTRVLDGREIARIVLEDARARVDGGDDSTAAARALRDAERLVEEGPDKPLLAVHFADGGRGWVVGAYGLALVTQDGGRSWQSLVGRIPNPRGNHLYRIQADGDALLIAGEQGVLFRSADGGESFEKISTPYGGTFFGALALDGGGLLAYGLRGNAWRGEEGGESGAAWTQVAIDLPVTLTGAQRLEDGSIVLADESGRLLRSTDGARSFAPLPAAAATGLSGLAQAADGALIVAGARGLARIEPAHLAPSARSAHSTQEETR